MIDPSRIRALAFDVFGTVVDWRSSIIREGAAWSRDYGIGADWAAFADAWRGLYQPALSKVRSGELPWTRLDDLHRMALDQILPQFGLAHLDREARRRINTVWHRLDPWPDSVAGLTRLKGRYIVAPVSNGHVALIVAMAKRAGLPWDVVLGAEVAQAYKPDPAVYLTAADMLGVAAGEMMMVAAHNGDLAAARSLGLRTAFVRRPTEWGPGQTIDLEAEPGADLAVESIEQLADRLNC